MAKADGLLNKHGDELFCALQRILPQHALSRLVAMLAETRSVWLKNYLIKLFIRHYGINLDELENPGADNYGSFNEFFTRPLAEGARPISSNPSIIASPADGTICQLGAIHRGELIQAKGKSYSVNTLLGEEITRMGDFENGIFSTIYLSPKDYHRVHMPLAAQLISSCYIPGKLFSVNPATSREINNLLARNERLVCLFNSDAGKFAMVLVGAMLVAGIESVWHGSYLPGQYKKASHKDIEFARGDEMGRFKFGSTVVLVFENKRAHWESALHADDSVKMGQSIGYLSQ